MAQERPNPLIEWLTILRKQAPILREQVVDWVGQVREEPALLWATPAVRYVTYGLAAMVIVWIVTGIAGAITPPPPASARPTATAADFHVVCSDPQCGHHFVVHREFGFRGFPVQCPRCERTTGFSARRCNSPRCLGRWIAPAEDKSGLKCPICGTRFE